MLITEKRLRRLIRRALLEQDSTDSDTLGNNTSVEDDESDTGVDTEDETLTDNIINSLFEKAREDIKRLYRAADYKRRVMDSGIMANEEKFDQFLENLMSEIDEAVWERRDIPKDQTHLGELEYSPSTSDSPTYEDYLREIPTVIISANRIAGIDNQEIKNLLVHELSHIENRLLDSYSVQHGSTGQRAFKREIGDIFVTHSQLRGLGNRFDTTQEFHDVVTMWTLAMGPSQPSHEMEMRARLAELRIKMGKIGESMEDAIIFAKTASFNDLVKKYGENPAHFLIFLDYDKDLTKLTNMVDMIASASPQSKVDAYA